MSDTCKGKVCPKLSGPVFVPKQGIVLHEVVCIEHRCAHYQHLLGKNPQTDAPLDHWDCAFNWTNILAIENAQQARQVGAAIERARNESVKSARHLAAAVIEVANAAGGRASALKDITPSGAALEHKEH